MTLMARTMALMARVWRGGRGELRLYLLSVFSLAVAFVCLASSLLVVCNLQAVQARWARTGRISVYLRDDTPEDDRVRLELALQQTQGVLSSRYVAPADARKEMAEEPLTASLAALPIEAFPQSIEVSLDTKLAEDQVADIATKLKALPNVESVETYERWTDKLTQLLEGGVIASGLLCIVVFAAVVSVIGSTIRLALGRRKAEIEVLKMVGATDGYVRGPFVVEGAIQGAVGAFASILLLGALYLVVRSRFDSELALLLGFSPTFLPWTVALGLIAAGALLGAVAALGGVRRLVAV